MKTPKARYEDAEGPVHGADSAMARFVDIAERIRLSAQLDDTVLGLCEDDRLARELLINAAKEKPRVTGKIFEYTSPVDDPEDEIMQYPIGAEQQSRRNQACRASSAEAAI